MTAIPHGERPLWIIVGASLLVIAWALTYCARPSNHERSIRYRNPKGRQDW